MTTESNDLHGMVPDSNETVLLLIDVINHLDFEGNEGWNVYPRNSQYVQSKNFFSQNSWKSRTKLANKSLRWRRQLGKRVYPLSMSTTTSANGNPIFTTLSNTWSMRINLDELWQNYCNPKKMIVGFVDSSPFLCTRLPFRFRFETEAFGFLLHSIGYLAQSFGHGNDHSRWLCRKYLCSLHSQRRLHEKLQLDRAERLYRLEYTRGRRHTNKWSSLIRWSLF